MLDLRVTPCILYEITDEQLMVITKTHAYIIICVNVYIM